MLTSHFCQEAMESRASRVKSISLFIFLLRYIYVVCMLIYTHLMIFSSQQRNCSYSITNRESSYTIIYEYLKFHGFVEICINLGLQLQS